MPNHLSMIFHSLEGCNFDCYHCFNHNLIKQEQIECYSEKDLLTFIELSGYLFDCIIFSGGEFLLSDIKEIKRFLNEIKQIFAGKIIINTNGCFPNKIEELYSNKLVDGIHLDIKLPYHWLDIRQDQELIKDILGVEINQQIKEKLLQSIDLVIKHNSKYDQLRTVKYPILDEQFFIEIKKYINQRKEKLNSNIPWYLNEFINEGEM